MSNYDDLPISDAHRKALEAGRKLFESRDALKLPDAPEPLKSADVGGCSVHSDAAQGAYAAAADAAFSGNDAAWVAAMAEGALFEHAYSTCLARTLYTKKEVFG